MSPLRKSMKKPELLIDKDKGSPKCFDTQKSQRNTRRELANINKSNREMRKTSEEGNSILLELVDTIKENNLVIKEISSRLPMLNPKEIEDSITDRIEIIKTNSDNVSSDEDEKRMDKNKQERRNLNTGSTRAENENYNVVVDWNINENGINSEYNIKGPSRKTNSDMK